MFGDKPTVSDAKPQDWTGESAGNGQETPRMRVLLAEDSTINAEMTQAMARNLGVSMDLAANGLDAIAMVQAAIAEGEPYALLLMDVMMPILDGVEATKRLRAEGIGARQLPIVAVTAATDLDEVRSYRKAGMQAFLEKPAGMQELKAVFRLWGNRAKPQVEDDAKPTLEGFRRQFEARKIEALAAIEAALATGQYDEDVVMHIRNYLHQIAGTAGSFGDDELSNTARAREAALLHAFYNSGDVEQVLEDSAKTLREKV